MKNVISYLAVAVISVVMASCSSASDYDEMNQEMVTVQNTTNINGTKAVDGTATDQVKVLVNNLLAGYEITNLVINGQDYSNVIAQNGSVVFELSSKEKINAITITCTIHSLDGSNETISNLQGVKDITNHSKIETVNLNADFLGLTSVRY